MIHVQKIQGVLIPEEDIEPNDEGIKYTPSEPVIVVRVDGHPCRVAMMRGKLSDEPTQYEAIAITAMVLQGAKLIIVHSNNGGEHIDLNDLGDLVKGHGYPHGLVVLTDTIDQADKMFGVLVTKTKAGERFDICLRHVNDFTAELATQKRNGELKYWKKGLTRQELHPTRRGDIRDYFNVLFESEPLKD